MQYTDRAQLTIVQADENAESIFMEECKRILLELPSNTIYFERQGKLFGIISTGDIIRACREKSDCVKINKSFSYVRIGESMKARFTFKEKRNINALPILSDDGVLIGDYTRWDDSLWLEKVLIQGEDSKDEKWTCDRMIALVRPDDRFADRRKLFNKFKNVLSEKKVEVQCIDYTEVFQYLKLADRVLVVDENEARAFGSICNIIGAEMKGYNYKISTYKNFLKRIDAGNNQCTVQIANLQNQGVTIMGLLWKETPYYEQLMEKISEKFAAIGQSPNNQLSEVYYKDFFADLYAEEYIDEIMKIPFSVENYMGVSYLRDCQSMYYNVKNGERQTIGQPETFEKTIYFLGACYIYGHWVEDRNTIESFLQKRLCDSEKAVRVVNLGCTGMLTCRQYFARIMSGIELKKGDILVIGNTSDNIEGVEYLDLCEILEKNRVGAEWMIDYPGHCNHKVNKLYADAVYEKLESVISEKPEEQGMKIEKDSNFVKLLYLDRYFSDFNSCDFEQIGSIVMNCNPFTYGHRYLIEKALETVDCLIIFVVEEDLSVFSFVERFAMVCEGVADLKNVMVVPSGPFILSNMSFPEYFIKETSEDISRHVEQDITTFAEVIAPQLGIKYRFVGEEPEDGVTERYNQAMKKILPQYGIKLVEIPRKTINGKYISASFARKYMDENDDAKLAELLPATTRKLMGTCEV